MPSSVFRIGRARTGLGLFAIKPIKRLAYIATYRGRRLADKEADLADARGSHYLFVLTSKWTIDGSPRWNKARYINHSCRPNARPITRNGNIVFIAERRIEADEEITFDYGAEFYRYFISNGGCRCTHCREKRARRRRKMARRSTTAAARESRRPTPRRPVRRSAKRRRRA